MQPHWVPNSIVWVKYMCISTHQTKPLLHIAKLTINSSIIFSQGLQGWEFWCSIVMISAQHMLCLIQILSPWPNVFPVINLLPIKIETSVNWMRNWSSFSLGRQLSQFLDGVDQNWSYNSLSPASPETKNNVSLRGNSHIYIFLSLSHIVVSYK